jgi:hypothetical protein
LNIIVITHRDDRQRQEYELYTVDEAIEKGLKFKHWLEAEEWEWAASDDGIVSRVLKKKEYKGRAESSSRTYYEFPWGHLFVRPNKRGSTKAMAKHRKFTVMKNGKWKKQDLTVRPNEKNFVTAYAATMDADLATEVVHPNPSRMEIHRNRRWSKTERFRTLLRNEISRALEDRNIMEGDIIDFLKEGMDMARKSKDIHNFLRVAENFQKMLGMTEPDKVVKTSLIEGSKTSTLIDQVAKEEVRLSITQTSEEVDVEKCEEVDSAGETPAEEIEIVQETEEVAE